MLNICTRECNRDQTRSRKAQQKHNTLNYIGTGSVRWIHVFVIQHNTFDSGTMRFVVCTCPCKLSIRRYVLKAFVASVAGVWSLEVATECVFRRATTATRCRCVACITRDFNHNRSSSWYLLRPSTPQSLPPQRRSFVSRVY